MRRSKRAEAVLQSGLDVKASDEITSAWNGLAQSKAALRQIENKLEAGPGSGVLLESVMVSSKKKPSRKDLNKDGQQRDQIEKSTKMRSGHSRSPEKSSSRGPLQNSTQENTARNSVEFREPLASYREATPPPHPSSKPELGSLQSATGSSYSSQLSNSNLVYERESRDKQTDEDVDSTHSSTVERMEIRYLNDLPALDTIRTNLSHSRELTREAIQQTSTVKAQILQSTDGKGSGSTPSTSPGSASQRLENLRRHQPDDKLEKLKERIRKQRKHLEEAAEKEKFGSYLERPLVGNDSCGTSTIPSVKVRKVAAAPSAPIYKGFNSTQTKIQTPDGKIWREEDFHNLSCGIYKDLSHQFAEGTRSLLLKGQGDFPKERKPHKSVRKVQKVHPISDLSRPAISPASWREGQKLVTMILGKNPIVTTEEPQKSKRSEEKGSHCRSSSEPGVELNPHKCTQSRARQQAISEFNNTVKASPSAVQEQSSVPVRSDMSDDIKGILDDLQLQCKNRESDERTHATSQRETSRRHNRGNSGSRSRATIPTVGTASARGCRSASPSNRSRTVNRVEPVQKKRHYDADTVRQYIAQQQEKRKRRQMQEKNALMKEAEQRQQRLQELYRKQREAALTLTTTTESPAQVHLKKTFNKLLHEGAQRTQEATQLRPIYQPSGESDKENRRLEQAQSLSSSDQSLNPLPGSSNDFHFGEASSAHPGYLIPTIAPVAGPVCSNEHLLSQLLRLESAIAASEKQTKKPITALNHSPDKMSRIEALKATATSLSNRIESEACKLAVEGFNYGLTTAVDADVLSAPRSTHAQGDDRVWTESDYMAFNTERLSGSSMLKGSDFPKQDCIVFKIPKEKNRIVNTGSYPQSFPYNRSFESVGLGLATAQEEHSEKNWQQHKVHPDPHNSSESLSEGPLSEGSLTDGDGSPLQSANAFRPIGHQGAVQHSGRKSHQRLSEFQKEAEQFAVVNSLLTQQENSNPVWEEFNKGSPLSVINIFTKTLQENVKVGDIFSERNSPSVHQLPSGSHVADLDYENDPQKDVHTSSCHYEELMRRSTRGAKAIDPSASSPQHSSCSTPGSSPLSKNSIKMRDQSAGTTLVEEHRSTPLPEALSLELRKWDSKRSSENSQITSDDISQLSHRGSNVAKMSPPSNNRQSPGSLDHSSLENSFSDSLRRSAPEKATNTSAADVKPSGELQYSPAVLQQRLAAELHYLESIEESVRQLGDIERLMGVSKAQHESETLSHMLKAKQQQHEQELYELKIKAEREALETKLQMEQNRQRVARAHIDLQEGLATTHKETLEGLQEATTKMMSQQAEAARYTADTARHIKEMTEMAHAHLINYTPPSVQLTSELLKKRSHARMRDNTNLSYESSRTGEDHLDHSESESYRSPGRSLSSEHKDTSHEPLQERSQRAEGSISIEDEVTTAANESLCNSIPSVQEERGDATSVATDYSHKFEESITEDEIEERSFRSLLPSEAHRRESLDRKLQHHNESEEDGMSHNCTPALVAYSITQHQRGSSAFSGGQDSFSHFTMEMVRQYMRDEEVRLQHQSALLRLRQKALKEKTRTELAWLEHQKKKLRDKGEDDKMPPIKKKQRGLLLKLQQEQAEIKRLQEANKAARKERQVLLKQQEEIERMRSSTLKLKERLRFAETLTEAPSETSLSEVASSNLEHTNLNVRSPSPSVSISGSETSSIMQKLKKMRSQTDEKFLTKREQQLMQRRHHAEELLQWKQRLDKEEAEVLKMEKKALAAWDEQPPQDKGLDLSESEKDFRMMQGSKDFTGDFNHSSATPESSIHTDVDVKQGETSASKSTSASDMASIQSSPANYTDDFASVSPSPNRPSDQKSPIKESIDVSVSEHDQMSKLGDITDNHDMKQTEHISDQRDIETRIRTLKEELKKRKLTAYQLKKEQKKRTKQRLKAQEANLLKQLETYNDFIEKTKAELEQQPDSTPDATSQITDGVLRSAEHPSETMTRERSHLTHVSESDGLPSFVDKAHPGQNRSVSMASTISGEEPPTLTPTPRRDSPDLCLFSKQSQAHSQENSNQNVTSEHEVEKQEKMETKMDTASESISPHPPFSKVFEQHVDSRSEEVSAKSPRSPLSSIAADVVSSVHSPEGTNKENRKVLPPLADNNEKSLSNSDQSSLKKNAPGWTTHSREEEIDEIAEELSGPSVVDSHQSLGDARDKGEIQADGRTSVTSNHSVSPLIIDEMAGFCIGDRVVVSGVQPGTLRFKGSTSFANGFWAGVELDKSEGSNNGTYDGVLYFECSERHGIFAPPDKVTHLTDKFDMYTDTTEDDDSFHDEMPKEENLKLTSKETRPQTDPFGNCLMSLEKLESGDLKSSDDIEQLDKAVDNYQHLDHTIVNGNTIWVSGDASLTPLTPFIDNDKVHISKQSKMEITNLIEKPDVELDHRVLFSSDLKKDERRKDRLGSLADEMLNDIVKNAVQHFAELKKSKVKKIHDANQMSRNKVEEVEETLAPSVDQKDGLPFFLTQEKEEMSSPELCNRPESPVLGASGQEELAKRLAELELSREMEEFGDDQDWFDEDYGLSSRRQQQRLKEKQLEEDQAKFGGHFGKTTSGVGTVMGGPGDQQVKTPPRPELPHPIAPKLPEEPAMVVPHSAAEIEKIAHAAVLEIWKTCGLDSEGLAILTNQQNPNPSQEYYGEDSHSDDLEAACLHSYKKAVYDLTWETLQDVFAEDPNADQPQWVKPQRVKSSSFHEIRTARDISRIQRFVSDEILKLYGLATDQCQRTDWPKMLKFGRKKRDRVDNILVQELHEEESQWVNYDEDELFVKMQLADSIFDALLKDTADALNLIYEKRAKRDAS
ncbi:unnamed protein product [Knipowitschia caucasica]